jgi:hypothetical protein
MISGGEKIKLVVSARIPQTVVLKLLVYKQKVWSPVLVYSAAMRNAINNRNLFLTVMDVEVSDQDGGKAKF